MRRARLVGRRSQFVWLAACVAAALVIGVAPAAADPPADNANVLPFKIACPGMEPFEVTVVGAVGFVEGDRLLAIRQATATQGSLELVECTATNPELGTQTVFLQFVGRGG
ncbi:MAG: hypothetical protein M3322_08465 [Actinomycetota bacterium]|nr:hypothetical protein [Actinomycetota bacterium]